jgi:Ferric iron reductase FhuF-like transporter
VAAVVPPLLHNGVAFEAHPQNMLLRLSRSTLTPTGFIMRDLGGLRVHPATLSASTGGTEFAFLPGHCVVASTPEDAAKKLYHTLVHNHLQRLARVLGLHGDGSAWSAVRAHLTREIPRGSWLWAAWMDESVRSVSGKCLVRMKLEGVYREVSCLFLPSGGSEAICPHLLIRVVNLSPVRLRAFSKLDTLSTRRNEWEVKRRFICQVKNVFCGEDLGL